MTRKSNWLFLASLTMAAIAVPLAVLAQIQTEPLPGTVTTEEWVTFVLTSMGGIAGLGALGIALIAVKIIIKTLNTEIADKYLGSKFDDWSGGMKLIVVMGLNIIVSVIGLMTTGGVSLGAAMIHGTTVGQVSIWINQIYQHNLSKKKAGSNETDSGKLRG